MKWCRLASILIALLACPAVSQQPRTTPLSSSANIRLVAVVPEHVHITALSDTARFQFSPGARLAQVAVPISLTWNLKPDRSQRVELYAFFDFPNQALTDPRGNAIPATRLSLGLGSGALEPVAGSVTPLKVTLVSETVVQQTTRQDLQLQLHLGQLPPPAGTYSSVLHLQVRIY